MANWPLNSMVVEFRGQLALNYQVNFMPWDGCGMWGVAYRGWNVRYFEQRSGMWSVRVQEGKCLGDVTCFP